MSYLHIEWAWDEMSKDVNVGLIL